MKENGYNKDVKSKLITLKKEYDVLTGKLQRTAKKSLFRLQKLYKGLTLK